MAKPYSVVRATRVGTKRARQEGKGQIQAQLRQHEDDVNEDIAEINAILGED